MTKSQKTIKYLAITFAFCLIISIFSSFIFGVTQIFNIFDSDKSSNKLEQIEVSENIKELDINLNITNLEIKSGNTFKIENDSTDVYYKIDGTKLVIKEKNTLFHNKKINKLIIYIDNRTFNDVDIDLDAGSHLIENLNSNKFSLDLGAGKVVINNITANNSADIETGAGKLTINNSSINNLKLELGAGSTSINATLTGYNDIELGAGKLDLNLLNSINDYTIKFEKGIGKATLNNNQITDNTYGTGSTFIDIEGGVGSINITTNN